jgi:hypothetical protein
MPLSWCHGTLHSRRVSVIENLSMSQEDRVRLHQILNQFLGDRMRDFVRVDLTQTISVEISNWICRHITPSARC